MADFETTKGMLLEPLELQLTDEAGVPVDLTTATSVAFKMTTNLDIDATVVNGAMSFVAPLNEGRVRYDWQAADVANVGYFYGQAVVTWSSGKQQAFPSDENYITLKITESLG